MTDPHMRKIEAHVAKEVASILNDLLGTSYSFLHPLVQRLTAYVENEIDAGEERARREECSD